MDEEAFKTTEDFIDRFNNSDADPENFRSAAAISLQLQLETIKLLKAINKHLDNGIKFDANAPCNVYGEGLVDGIQNAIERGQRGISTHGG